MRNIFLPRRFIIITQYAVVFVGQTNKHGEWQSRCLCGSRLTPLFKKGKEPPLDQRGRAQLKPDGTRWRTVGEVKGKHASGVGSQ